MRALILAFVLLALIGGLLFFLFGKSIWYPYYVKMSGGQTVESVVESLKKKGIGIDPVLFDSLNGLIILGLKEERMLEVWGKREGDSSIKVMEFPFTGYSGRLGPKLREGDGQIPEGIYRIEYLNPNSSFHLSMKVDYPNEFDRLKGKEEGREKLGFDIFIHGKSSTVGCIPIGDEAIEELFLLVAEVGPENVQVILSPYDMRSENREILIEGINWEAELYKSIRSAIMKEFPVEKPPGVLPEV